MTETDRFAGFFRMLGFELHDFQRLIVDEVFSERRETLVLIPRGCGKSTLMAGLGLWLLLREPGMRIVVGAASREQASVVFDAAREMAQHPEVAPLVEPTRREIRLANGWLKVIAADGPKQHGLIVDMAIIDELHAHARDDLYIALRTAMLKKPGARTVVISTAGATSDTPLGELYERARKLPTVERDGPLTRAEGDHLAMLEWRADDPNDLDQVLAANPAPWITRAALEEQKASVHELAFKRYHANVWTGGQSPFITADAWDCCAGPPTIDAADRVVVGLDASIRHDATAVTVVARRRDDTYDALFRVWTPERGSEVPLGEVEEFVRELARHFRVERVVYDEYFFHHAAQRLEQDGIEMWAWRHSRMVGATRTLLDIVRAGRLRHGGDPIARRHALAAEVAEREQGLLISKRRTREPIDALVSLAMAVEMAAGLEPPRRSVYEERGLVSA